MNIRVFAILSWAILQASVSFADGALYPYYFAQTKGSIDDVASNIKTVLEDNGFTISGDYHPGKEEYWYVMAFTNDKLKEIAFDAGDFASMAAMLRIGIREIDGGKVELNLLNPFYLFYSYLRYDVGLYEGELNAIQQDLLVALKTEGYGFMPPFGSQSLTEMELKDYRFLSHMPGFTDYIELHTFSNFDKAVGTISVNLRAQREGTYKVYELVNHDREIAVFGVGLRDERLAEDKFLKILGEKNLAALPYELIVVGKTAYILHGRFRFPLYWPNVSMDIFRKINRTTRDIEYMMRRLTE